MIKLKNPQEIEIMREGGKILARVLDEVIKEIKPGVKAAYLNELAEKLIKEKGGEPSFKGYKTSWADRPFPSALCVSINEEVVHGIPVDDLIIKNGDIVGLDCGLKYKGMYTDMAKTVAVGNVESAARKLILATNEALMLGIKQAKVGNKLSNIGRVIQARIEKSGFSAVRQLVGHGVGYKAHEEPQVANYVDPYLPDVVLQKGMTLALEPMANIGGWEVDTLDDGWTIVTADGSLSAHFEHTIAVGEKGGEILTKL